MNVLDCQWKRNASLQYITFWTTWYPQMAIIKINDFRSKLNTVIDRVWIRYILDYQSQQFETNNWDYFKPKWSVTLVLNFTLTIRAAFALLKCTLCRRWLNLLIYIDILLFFIVKTSFIYLRILFLSFFSCNSFNFFWKMIVFYL